MARVRHALAGMGVVALVAAAAISPPAETMATWIDGESSSGSFAAKTIAAPAITNCTIGNTLGIFASVTITWTAPAGSGYTNSNFQPGFASTASGLAPQTANVSGSGPYSATYTSGLLETLLGALFGTSFVVGVRSTEGGWTSPWVYRTVNVGLLGLGSTCSPS